MTHVITRSCCNDAACVAVCPKNCIHPRPGDADFATAEMLKIDPASCIDCGACVEVCPVGAIVPDHRLTADTRDYLDLNRAFFEDRPSDSPGFVDRPSARVDQALRVAVVGSGPASIYAVEHLLERLPSDSEIHVYERLATPWGLVRYGVAPDHQDTKQVSRSFERVIDDPRVSLHLNVEIGADVKHEDLAACHHAVVYGVGAPASRGIGVPGESLPGVIAAADLVAWYNGHPDLADLDVPLSGRRAVVVGNGNVALDVARILAAGHHALDRSDIADHALQALQSSSIEEVVVLGRRGPAEAAYTSPELLSLVHHPAIDVRVGTLPSSSGGDLTYKEALVRRLALGEFATPADPARRRVVLRYAASPTAVLGERSVTGVRITHNALVHAGATTRAVPTEQLEDLDCSLLVHAVGHRARPIPGLPFDEETGLVPNRAGRVLSTNGHPTATYVVGWSKRGPSGVIGTNKACAEETVGALVDDFREGRLNAPVSRPEQLSLPANALDSVAWRRIDLHERTLGRAVDRPRSKVTDHAELLDVGRGTSTS